MFVQVLAAKQPAATESLAAAAGVFENVCSLGSGVGVGGPR